MPNLAQICYLISEVATADWKSGVVPYLIALYKKKLSKKATKKGGENDVKIINMLFFRCFFAVSHL